MLESITHQSFLRHGGRLEVIIVDDASSPPLLSVIEPYEDYLQIFYLRFPNNLGAGASRDKAILLAKNDLVVFIDSDIILPSSFVSNHAFVHCHIPQTVILVSFRENVRERDPRVSGKKQWKQGNRFGGDHRVSMCYKQSWVMRECEKKYVGREFRLLAQTDNFKKFGHGQIIELWTLPMMVLTCAMSVRRERVLHASPIPRELRGWGFNDTCLAAKMIAGGAKVIPNFNSTVLHLLEKKHTKLDHQKNQEFLRNERIYKKFLKQEYEEESHPVY